MPVMSVWIVPVGVHQRLMLVRMAVRDRVGHRRIAHAMDVLMVIVAG